MKYIITIGLLNLFTIGALGQAPMRCEYKNNRTDTRSEEEFKRLHAEEIRIVLSGDATAWESFYQGDHIVSNPFNQMIDKKTVLERVRSNVIRYKSYEKKIEYLCVYEDAAVIAGTELSLPADDADRPDAGKFTKRRFTETWIRRNKRWGKVARHVSTIADPTPAGANK